MKKLVVGVGILLVTLGVANSSPWPPPDPPYTPHATVMKEGEFTYWCNGAEPIVIPIEVIQNIHHWLYVHWQPTRITWDVYKPGRYATNCLYSKIESNGDVVLILENPPQPDTPVHTFFISGPHNEPYDVPDVITNDQITEVIDNLTWGNLLLIPPVGPGETNEVVLPGGTPYILKLWDELRVDFHTQPGQYVAVPVITVIKLPVEVLP